MIDSLKILVIVHSLMSFTDRTPPNRKHEPFQPPLEDPLSAGKRTLNALFDCF